MRTELRAPDVPAIPGQVIALDIDVVNTSDVIDGITARVEGLDPSWVHLPVPVLSLFPDTGGSLPVHVTFPPGTIVGEYLVIVHIESTIDPMRHSQHEVWLRVEPVESASMRLRPSVVTRGSSASVDAIVTNSGNVESSFTMTAIDETRALSCTTDPLTLVVPPGRVGVAVVTMEGKRPWFGQPVARTVTVSALSPTIELRNVATFNQKPRIPRGVLTILLLAMIVALWATIILVGVDLFRSDEKPTKVVASNFNDGGTTDVPLEAVAASLSGKVTAGSTGEGLVRITVEAYRIEPKGGSELTSSAATIEDGTYTLAALLPGKYKLRFTAEGFEERWYPAALTEKKAKAMPLDPTEEREGIDIELPGAPGTFSGNFALPDSAEPAPPVMMTVTQVPGPPAPGEKPEKPPEPIKVPVDGPFSVPGLVTPATYRVRIEAKGFEPQEFEQDLAGGEDLVLNTIRLEAADGSIAGVVRSSTGEPLGDVAVTVTSGDLTREATTATVGNVGEFTIDRLETPATYVLTLTDDKFGSQTIALDLAAGANRTGVDVVLTGGTGVIAGSAVDVAGNPMGGVTVSVSGGDFAATTATLTTSGPDAPVGSYRVSGVPTPGNYTITFSADGFVSETINVGFIGPGSQSGVTAILHRATATVTGQATDGGGAAVGVTVTLSDGTTTLTTATSSTPPGGYAFTNVPPGSYALTFSSPRHQQRVVLISVASGDRLVRNVGLRGV